MNLKFKQSGSTVIVYDADCIQQPGQHLFDPEYWQKQNAIVQTVPGRGQTLMLDTPFGAAVMRTYLRGGLAAQVSRDRYVFTGFANSRPLAEVRILAELASRGLPVPQPLGALCVRHGLTYSGTILMRRIMPATPLADMLEDLTAGQPGWFLIGQCIRRFHDAGLVHPDLNASNILLGDQSIADPDIYLVDFDRAWLQVGAERKFRANLRRLRRSLLKIWPVAQAGKLESCWIELMNGYNSPG